MTFRRGRVPRLSLWLYAAGLVQLAVLGLSLLAVAHLDEPPARALVDMQARLVAASLANPPGAEHVDVQAIADRFARAIPGEVTIITADGVTLASGGAPPPSPFTLEGHADAMLSGREAVHVTVAAAMPAPAPRVPLTAIAVVLGVVGLGAIGVARFIGGPLEHLAAVADALGAGDLRIRSGIQRRDEIGALARAFDAMGSRIETLVLAQSELLANVSHELRTPLSRMRVALDLLIEGGEPDRHLLSEIATDLSELEQLVNDVLAAARLDLARGKPEQALRTLAVEPVIVGEFCEQIAQRFRSRHASRPLDVSIENGAKAITVHVAPGITRRAIENLLDNAAHYSPVDQPIAIRVRTDEDAVAVEIEDHGIGMSDADARRAFEPFFRAERARALDGSGLGLGLTLSRRIVEAQGGSLQLKTAPDRGTTATLRLPVRRAVG